MSDMEYEEWYLSAVKSLHASGHRVSKPFLGKDGNRKCLVNGWEQDDQTIFSMAWGENRAEEIQTARTNAKLYPESSRPGT